MKGVSVVTNDQNQRTAVMIDLKVLEKRQSELEDFLDGLIALSRTGEATVSWEEAKKALKKAGKL